MSFEIRRLADPAAALFLFDGWEETIVWAALDGTMGDIYADEN